MKRKREKGSAWGTMLSQLFFAFGIGTSCNQW